MRNRKCKTAVIWIPITIISLMGVGTAGYLAAKKHRGKHFSTKR